MQYGTVVLHVPTYNTLLKCSGSHEYQDNSIPPILLLRLFSDTVLMDIQAKSRTSTFDSAPPLSGEQVQQGRTRIACLSTCCACMPYYSSLKTMCSPATTTISLAQWHCWMHQVWLLEVRLRNDSFHFLAMVFCALSCCSYSLDAAQGPWGVYYETPFVSLVLPKRFIGQWSGFGKYFCFLPRTFSPPLMAYRIADAVFSTYLKWPAVLTLSQWILQLFSFFFPISWHSRPSRSPATLT